MRIPSGSVDRYIYFVAVDSTDLKTRETGLATFTVYRSRDGGAAAVYDTPTINETDSGNMPGVYELLIDEDTTLAAGHDTEEYVVHITHAGMAPVTRTVEIYRPKITEGSTATSSKIEALPTATAGTAGGLFIAGSNAATSITSSTGPALTLESTGSNGQGLIATGHGTASGIRGVGGATSGNGMALVGNGTGHGLLCSGGNGGTTGDGINATSAATTTGGRGIFGQGSVNQSGLRAVGGPTGTGFTAVGGSTSGNGAAFTATLSGHGFSCGGLGSSNGINATGGATGNGINAQSGTGATGDGFSCTALSTNGRGIIATGKGTGSGIRTLGGATASDTGHGINAISGAGTTGDGINATSIATNGRGLHAMGNGTGSGIRAVGGSTSGNGIYAIGDGSGHGLSADGGPSSGDGIRATLGAGGVDIRGNITGTITTATNVTTVNGLANNVITAASIAASALNGKGDWSTHTAADVWAAATRTLTSAANITSDATAIVMSSSGIVGTVNLVNTTTTNTDMRGTDGANTVTPPTATAIADQVWDEATADHQTAGSTGKALTDAGSAGDPWSTALPGSYTAGQAGKIVGDNLNATVGSRSSHTAADVWTAATRTLTSAANITSDASAIVMSSSGVVGTVNLVNTTTANSDMRGTDNAALASVCTETRLAELDAANLPQDVANVQADTDDIQTRLPAALTTGTADSGTTTTCVDAARTEADTDYWKGSYIRFTSGTISGQTRLITGFTPGTDTITFAPATTQAVATNTYEILPAGGADVRQWVGATPNALVGGAVDADVSVIQPNTIDNTVIATDAIGSGQLATTAVNEIRDSILSDATTFAGANIDAAVSTRATPVQVNAEVVDVLKTDTITLPGQTAPPLTPTFEQAVSWLYKVLRNRTSQTATTWSLYADDESTVDAKATVSDDGTTAIKEEIVTGP